MPSHPPIPLWPNFKPLAPEDPPPKLTPYLLDKPTKPGFVIVCPGGGYGGHAPHEGPVIAEFFNAHGYPSAVLSYRLGMKHPHRHPEMLNDAQRAVRIVREHADQWGIDPRKIAIIGFSAGGHLVSSLTVLFDRFTSVDDDLAPRHSARPDAAVLCYPVITLTGPSAHMGSRRNLLGPDAPEALAEELSTHRQVSPDTPPIFIWHTAEDGGVPVANSMMFADACHHNKVPCDLHVFQHGRHGVGLAQDIPVTKAWTGLMLDWLEQRFA
ncbi:MAG: alpha/beta hydrolase fold domain-containing protein [Phycisphaera sp.]|nr:alpha/beta hydrolase fold domain-containing protein [Phycisphaera sp.]